MNLAIITTLGINAGDNFIYEGFRRIFPPHLLGSTFLIDKGSIPRDKGYRRWIDAADLVVICGSPVLYHNCYKMHWQCKLLDYCERRRKPVLLFAIGSNFPCSTDGTCLIPDTEAEPEYAQFVQRYGFLAWKPISVRDPYALDFVQKLDILDAVPLHCPSLFAQPIRENTDGEWIGVVWGETYWQAPLKPNEVLGRLVKVKKRLAKHFPDKQVVWFTHDERSYYQIRKAMGATNVIFSNNYTDYFAHYARCAVAISTKVHGTMLLASMGIPSVLLQLDSREATLRAIGESGMPLTESPKQIATKCIEMWEARRVFRERIKATKAEACEKYAAYFGQVAK